MHKLTVITPFIIMFALAAVAIGQFRDARGDLAASKTEYVQTACGAARNEISSTSEQKCGAAQDEANAEYLCNASGTSCWVELK